MSLESIPECGLRLVQALQLLEHALDLFNRQRNPLRHVPSLKQLLRLGIAEEHLQEVSVQKARRSVLGVAPTPRVHGRPELAVPRVAGADNEPAHVLLEHRQAQRDVVGDVVHEPNAPTRREEEVLGLEELVLGVLLRAERAWDELVHELAKVVVAVALQFRGPAFWKSEGKEVAVGL